MQWRRPPRAFHQRVARLHDSPSDGGWRLYALGIAILMSPVGPGALDAQWRGDVEVGAGRVEQPQTPAHSAAAASASLGWIRDAMSVAGSAGVTLPSAGVRRGRGALVASLRTDPRRVVSIEATAAGSAYDESRFQRLLSGFAGVRLHARAGVVGLWGGGAAGSLDDGTHTYPHTTFEAGVTTGWRSVRLAIGATHNRTLGEPRIEFDGDPPLQVTVRDRLQYTDADIAVHARLRRLELDSRLGQRHVHRTIAYEEIPSARAFGAASFAWWVNPRVALAGSVGHELADLARGLPEARYATLGLRVRLHELPVRAQRSVPPREVPAGAAPDVLIERGSAAGVTLRVLASPSVHSIEVTGTFTAWEAVPLTADGFGGWSLATPVEAGQHRVMVRVNGGAWAPPANLPSVDDGLGGRVGLFTVAEGALRGG